ncbi:MAG: patatin-like phospholipase family protein, partial [Polyangiaceae bacterium]|nr:patatin-like phospholipase family protein [Polyangiaceae bacterium]
MSTRRLLMCAKSCKLEHPEIFVRMNLVPKIAFVASGGAARGLSHLGVLRACEDLGIYPEVFVGTSAGAIVSALYAQNMSLDRMVDGYRLPWRRRYRGPRLH